MQQHSPSEGDAEAGVPLPRRLAVKVVQVVEQVLLQRVVDVDSVHASRSDLRFATPVLARCAPSVHLNLASRLSLEPLLCRLKQADRVLWGSAPNLHLVHHGHLLLAASLHRVAEAASLDDKEDASPLKASSPVPKAESGVVAVIVKTVRHKGNVRAADHLLILHHKLAQGAAQNVGDRDLVQDLHNSSADECPPKFLSFRTNSLHLQLRYVMHASAPAFHPVSTWLASSSCSNGQRPVSIEPSSTCCGRWCTRPVGCTIVLFR